MSKRDNQITCALLTVFGAFGAIALFLSGAHWAQNGWPTWLDEFKQFVLFLMPFIMWGAAGIFFERGWLQRETPRDPWGSNEPPRGTAPRLGGYQPRHTGEHPKNPPRRP